MGKFFKEGDQVEWMGDPGRAVGQIEAVHLESFEYGGIRWQASKDEPMYEVRNIGTGQIDVLRGAVLRLAAHGEAPSA